MSEHRRAHIYKPGNPGAWLSDHITAFSGSWLFIGLHTVWFALWFVFRLDINTLTLIVSLEAIYLASLVLMSQNRSGVRDHARDELEAQEVDQLVHNGEEIKQVQHEIKQVQDEIKQINLRQSEILEAKPPAAPRKR